MSKILVSYFSCIGYTKKLRELINTKVGGDLYEIVPKNKYSEEDLDWTNPDSRCSREMMDLSSRPELNEIKDVSSYDTIFVGYPIWWGKAPTIINTFLESIDLKGKTIIPYATYQSSGIGESDKYLIPSCEGSNYIKAKGFSMTFTEDEVSKWLNTIIG